MFSLHPTELRRKRGRCAPVVESWVFDTETLRHCDLCGREEIAVLGNRDRYGFDIRTAFCLTCGAVFLMDRMHIEDYRKFYEGGTYRALIGHWKGITQTESRLQGAQRRYAIRLCAFLSEFLPDIPGSRLLDIGGSTGDVAHEIAKRYGYSATVLDPAPDEVEIAKSKGLRGIVGTLDSWEHDGTFDMILLCRTLEHLPDVPSALSRIRALLSPGGLFYCDIADFLSEVQEVGAVEAVSKIDHCTWLTQETAQRLFGNKGFEVVAMDLTLPPNQVGFMLRASDTVQSEPVEDDWLEGNLRNIRSTLIAWKQFGRSPVDLSDRLRRVASRIRKQLRG